MDSIKRPGVITRPKAADKGATNAYLGRVFFLNNEDEIEEIDIETPYKDNLQKKTFDFTLTPNIPIL